MSKTVDLGPVSAYALAVKYGYAGTEEEWVAEMEKKRIEAVTAASNAQSAATEASQSNTESANSATASANSATASANSASAASDSATLAESYTHGGTGTREGEDTDNARYYMEQAKAVSAVDIMTVNKAGIGKPDGTTITVDEDGTLHGNSEVTVDSELSKESENPVQNKTVAEELEKKINSDGDSKDLTTTFTSNDSTNVTEWTDVGLLTSGEKHSSLFQKVATMFKNIRYLYHMLGTADISTLGEGANIGTVTGAISKLNSDLSKIKGAYTVRLAITETKTYNETAWTEINELSYTVPQRSIFVSNVHIPVTRNSDGYVEFFFNNRYGSGEYKANVINFIDYTVVGVASKGDVVAFHLGTNENYIITIHGVPDERCCCVEHLIIPLE